MTTTREFIKMLEKADPSGEAHVRMEGGIPVFAELKAGYWDGPYTYIDEQGRHVYSIKDAKVDIHCKDIGSFIWNDLDYYPAEETEEQAWERCKKLFVFELDGYAPEQIKEREERFMAGVRETFDHYIKYEKESSQKYLGAVLEKFKNGWKFLQKKAYGLLYYDWKILDENGKDQGANAATTEPILRSGKWKNEDKGEYLEWTPIEEQPTKP